MDNKQEIIDFICDCGFNPDVFSRRRDYAELAIRDFKHDMELVKTDFPQLATDFKIAIAYVEGILSVQQLKPCTVDK